MRIGLIGAGRWGTRYIETLKHIPGVRLTHLASTNFDSRKLVPEECLVTPYWRDVAENRDLDGVILATPPAMHFEMALAAIRAGIPVLVEKPMTLSLVDARALVDAATTHDVLTMVGHTHLFSAAFRELKRKGNALGQLMHTSSAGGNWGPFRPDTPMLWDWGPHDIAMCLDLFGGFPSEIRATHTGEVKQLHGNGEAVAITLDFEKGASAEIHLSNIERQKRRLFEATYAGGTLVYDDLALNKLVFHAASGAESAPVVVDKSLPLANLVAEFCRSIGQAEHLSPSLGLGLNVIEVLSSCQATLDRAKESNPFSDPR